MEKENKLVGSYKDKLPMSDLKPMSDDPVNSRYTFHLGNDQLLISITRLGFGDQNIKRGVLTDGDRILHYELEDDSIINIIYDSEEELDQSQRIEWESILHKGAYQFKIIGDSLQKGIIDRLRLSSRSVF